MEIMHKTVVLCGVKIFVKDRGHTDVYENVVGVAVDLPSQIESDLRRKVFEMGARGVWPGVFVKFEWMSYLPSTGTRDFGLVH